MVEYQGFCWDYLPSLRSGAQFEYGGNMASCSSDDPLSDQASLTFGWIWELADPEIEKALVSGMKGKKADIVIYNAGLPDQACPPCKKTGGVSTQYHVFAEISG